MWEEGPAGLGILHHVFAEVPGMVVCETLEVPLLDESTATCYHGCFTLSRGRPSLMCPKHFF